jgi:AmmeMemoRadiSam system protein B
MAVPLQPRLRPLDIVPVGRKQDMLFAVRDPEGFGEPVVVSYGAALAAAMLDGRHTLDEIRTSLQGRIGAPVAIRELEKLVGQLDHAYLLAGERFENHSRRQIREYLDGPVRPAAHAGGAYESEPETLREQLAGFFGCRRGPGAPRLGSRRKGRRLCAVVSPHIDLHRGGPTFAWAYHRLARHADADLFVIFGTAHRRMREMFSVSRKDFATPLGVVPTDRRFIDQAAEHLASSVAGRQLDLFADETAHRCEHSIEFQVTFLEYLLGGKRDFRIVPVLVGSFHEFIQSGSSPGESPEVQALVAAIRAAAGEHPGKVCYISGADLAHVGREFGDDWRLEKRHLQEQAEEDRRLLDSACRGDAEGFFQHVARQNDCRRICGLAPTYVMLQAVAPARGELLQYDQAAERDGSSCVTFASLAFYES